MNNYFDDFFVRLNIWSLSHHYIEYLLLIDYYYLLYSDYYYFVKLMINSRLIIKYFLTIFCFACDLCFSFVCHLLCMASLFGCFLFLPFVFALTKSIWWPIWNPPTTTTTTHSLHYGWAAKFLRQFLQIEAWTCITTT